MHVHIVALRYFGETARCGSMRQASESLNVAASAVNRQILKLEDQLRTKLFERRTEGVRLTASGEVLYNYILRLERDLDRAISEIDDLRGMRRGRVTVACEDGIARDFLPSILSRFHRDYPGVTYSIEIARPPAILAAVLAGETDIGLTMFPPERGDLTIVADSFAPLGVIAPWDHPLAARPFVRMSDLVDVPMIAMKEGVGSDPDLNPFMSKWIVGHDLIETNTPDAMTNLVKAGLGAGIRSPIGIMREIEARELAFVPLRDKAARTGRFAVYIKAQRTLQSAGALLLEQIKVGMPAFSTRIDRLLGTQQASQAATGRHDVAASVTAV